MTWVVNWYLSVSALCTYSYSYQVLPVYDPDEYRNIFVMDPAGFAVPLGESIALLVLTQLGAWRSASPNSKTQVLILITAIVVLSYTTPRTDHKNVSNATMTPGPPSHLHWHWRTRTFVVQVDVRSRITGSRRWPHLENSDRTRAIIRNRRAKVREGGSEHWRSISYCSTNTDPDPNPE